ncbi:MAG: class I SAM-dependent methyltransferase [Paenibacillus sp.]|nr:class I SAM-dependent methyltransferase [Paenibacillus sp.]
MIPEGNSKANIDRFLGFQEDYDRYRPAAPIMVTTLLKNYLGAFPSLVVDIGCGTGLSTFLWEESAKAVIGIEPNTDMLSKAIEKLNLRNKDGVTSNISFAQGYANNLNLASESVDIVTCSQSFHWMEPASTLSEVVRVLRKGGVFAAYDCDWPLMLLPSIETRYTHLIAKADDILTRLLPSEDRAHKWSKDEHLSRIQAHKGFSFSREIVFHNTEPCNAERYIGLTLSQGGIQTVMKLGISDLEQDITEFQAAVEKYFNGRTLEILISYRMRLGIKY